MKFFRMFLFFLFTSQLCTAQDTTIVLSAKMLDKSTNQIDLSSLDGWKFKQGGDKDLARLNTDSIGWKKLKPEQLYSGYADKNGRVEGWFRITIKFDPSLLNKQIAFNFPKWSATELYMDGKQVASRGNMGNNGQAFHGYNTDIDPFTIRFETPTPHIFTFHFVGYVSSYPPYELEVGYRQFILLGPNYYTTTIKSTTTITTFLTLWLVVCAILSALFWLLHFQNRQEKNLFWIALCTTVLTISQYFTMGLYFIDNSYFENSIYTFFTRLLMWLFLIVLIPLLLTKIFKRKLNSKLLIFLLILFSLNFLRYFLDYDVYILQIILPGSVIISLLVCSYYVITSWKKLKGAQWAIVVGLIFSIFSFLVPIILLRLFSSLNSLYFYLPVLTCSLLTLPLSLMVYVSLRFKEIIKEVQVNANIVVELSEEKKLHAENQQKILQEEVDRQTAELRTTLNDLKATQSQLIQSEKMASLGELTAGIAHEIQNPLNFVNNFSEVNKEMITEMKDEIDKGNYDEVKLIAKDIEDNEEKINHHGKRADAIVKGMLQHSRSSNGVKEPTDINALCDEYLRLSYHGLRAKDKSFNATFKTDFDESIGKINIIPQDIGRVILNLLTNAFYAVDEKKNAAKEVTPFKKVSPLYEPTVSLITKQYGDRIEISVGDNGNGIRQNILDKVFQPFFTTKPTGQGTGLGLSLSYDIVKAHGGEIIVESGETDGTTFRVILPVK